jgi:hypothetical protein
MSYYTVLSATTALLQQQNFTVRRCRRRFNGPHRYVLHDTQGNIFHFDDNSKNRRMGYTLFELLDWLAKHPTPTIVAEARTLMRDLDSWHQLKTANI